ncbi:MAG TPA: superoxide dismutase family protein [Motilibacteraceae bacterium]|nr:superoxide dismutase family protein [Motilibacteraceae bacterium]
MRRPAPSTATRTFPALAVAGGLVLFAASPALAGADRVRAEGPLIRYGADPQIPAGAWARVQAVYDAAGSTVVTLHVRGLQPHHAYGAHAHQLACSQTDPLAAKGHYQHVPAPVGTPASDPAYANPLNEIWLDVVTDEDGNGSAQTRVPWQFSPDRRAGSVMLHAERTHDGTDGPAGTAGARLACLTVDF